MEQEGALAELPTTCEEENEESFNALAAEDRSHILLAGSTENYLTGGGALHYHARCGNVGALKLLLSKPEAAKDMIDKDKNTVLHVAVNKVEALKELLGNKCVRRLINHKNNDGDTPLLLAIKRDCQAACEVLLGVENVDVEAEDAKGWSAIHLAVRGKGFEDLVKTLLRTCSRLANKPTKEGSFTPLHLAARGGNVGICDCLLRYDHSGDFLSKEDADGDTALFFSVYSRKVEAVQFFLKKLHGNKEALNHTNKEGETALHKAIALLRYESSEEIELANTWIKNRRVNLLQVHSHKGETLLHVASRAGHLEIVKALLERENGLTGIADCAGETALHEAARACHKDVVEVLLESDPHPVPFKRDGDGRTALHWVAAAGTAEENTALEIARILLAKADEYDSKDLLLWASAGPVNGLPIDMARETSPVKKYLRDEMNSFRRIFLHETHTIKERPRQKWSFTLSDPMLGASFYARTKSSDSLDSPKQESLLVKAFKKNDISFVKDFINRGADICELLNRGEDISELPTEVKEMLIMKKLKSPKSDQPTSKDSLGRMHLAKGVAALLLNPSTSTPITIGILGKWGSGKSSTMLQVEFILLLTIFQTIMKCPQERNWFPGVKEWKFTKQGERLQRKITEEIKNKHLKETRDPYKEVQDNSTRREQDHDHTLRWFLEQEWQNYDTTLKGLALADRTKLFEQVKDTHRQKSSGVVGEILAYLKNLLVMNTHQKETSEVIGEIPAVLTVSFNAWLYESKEEATAGLAVEVTRQMEQYMTVAQWFRARFYHACKRNRIFILQKLAIPLILFALLGGLIAWIVLKLLPKQESNQLKGFYYGSIPVSLVVVMWTVFGNIFKVIEPISERLAGYKVSKEHEAKLGYRQMVIDDIRFLKKQICEKPSIIWKFLGWWLKLFRNDKDYIPGELRIPKLIPPHHNLRVVVFIDDLDRCEAEYVIGILRAINLILSVCEINVVLGVDKEMVEKAIMKQFKSPEKNDDGRDLAQKFLEKIIHLPVDLPEPSKAEIEEFLSEDVFCNQPVSVKTEQNADSVIIQMDEQGDRSMSENGSKSGTKNESNADGSRSRSEIPRAIELPAMVELARHNESDLEALKHLASGGNDHPREWNPREGKRFLNYYRFAWNIVSESQFKMPRQIDGWKRQLTVWVFVCWRWKDQMNEIIENWDKIIAMKKENEQVKYKDAQAGPSLRKIVNQYWVLKKRKEDDEGGKNKEDAKKKDDEDEKKVVEAAWDSLCNTLTKEYDVRMEGIQAFQKFRFYCKTDNLKWPIT